MTMICYTRNFEDVILQRVLADVAQGYFIDVGACGPVNDSNTYALYQKGWRGVAIEPLPFQALWKETRPEDVFLCAAAGSEPGRLTFHIFDQATQVSSGSPETLAHWQRNGQQPTRTIDVPVVTLNQVIAAHLPGKPLHLLLIDVEGMELEVLRGLDLAVHRPWVMIIEATIPGTPVPSHQKWEPYLLAADYMMAHFDGLNRFYLAREQQHLSGRFSLPPNVWDNFVTAKEIQLQAQIDQLKKQLENVQTKFHS